MGRRLKVVVLVSGGMDSVAALYHAHAKSELVAGLSFEYGSKHNHKEIPLAEWHCRRLDVPHQTIRLGFIGQLFASDLLKSGGAVPDGHYAENSMKRTVVPFRNGIMLSVAAGFAESIGAAGLVIAAHSGDHTIYPDCREPFMKAIAEAIQLGTYAGIRVLRPFIHLSKSQIARQGHRLGVDFAKTWSCYKGQKIHCGTCGTCQERREAFQLAKLPDPTVYRATPPLAANPKAVTIQLRTTNKRPFVVELK